MATQPLQFVCSGYSQNCQEPVLTPPQGEQINLYSAKVLNQSGGAIDMGIGKLLAGSAWKFYQYTLANTPYVTDYTTAIQAGGAGCDIFDTTIGDGYLVGANVPFNIIGQTITTGASGSPVYKYQYYNGTAWTTLTTQAVPAYATGTSLVVFPSPQDWVPGTPTAATVGADQSKYYILVTTTTAPSGVIVTSTAWVVEFIDFASQVANNTSFEFKVFDSVLPIVLSGTESIVPYFSGSANAKNMMRVVYSIQG